jgi:ubiquinone/menaquinone biosynthesis C-methylase UbiE
MTTTIDSIQADHALKAKQRAVWASGDYPAVAREIIPALGRVLVGACGIRAGQRVLDVAAGTGNAAIPAAELGAKVTASDLTPELLDAGRALAVAHGVDLDWRQADVEALPWSAASFDVVMSCVGVMFAPNHQRSAHEMVRVCRPGGTIGLISWTPQGFIGQMLATMKPYAPTPPAGSQPPPLWGQEEHATALFDGTVSDVHTRRQFLRVDHFATAEDFLDYFKTHYGPTIAVYRHLAEDPGRAAELDRGLVELANRQHQGGDGLVMDWEYLVLTARTNQ